MFNRYYKLILIICLSLLLVGCYKKEKIKRVKKQKPIVKEEYNDNNSMPIGLYQDTNKSLKLIETYQANFVRGTDIAVFQVFPSKEKNVSYTKNFAEDFYEKWVSNNTNNKIGFNIKYNLKDGTKVSHTILKPDDTMAYGGYLEVYLYDDYIHRNDSWYSHVEGDYTPETLFTSIKLTPGRDIDSIDNKITLTVFTYDTDDDIDDSREYRGNSKYSIDILRLNN